MALSLSVSLSLCLSRVTACVPEQVVLIHGGPLAVESAQENDAVRAIVDAFQPGELGETQSFKIMCKGHFGAHK